MDGSFVCFAALAGCCFCGFADSFPCFVLLLVYRCCRSFGSEGRNVMLVLFNSDCVGGCLIIQRKAK